MDAYATIADYEARYGEAEYPNRVESMLADASAFIASQPGLSLLSSTDPGYDVQSANLVRITCSVVHRALSAGDLAGLSSYSEGAVGYTASVNVYNPGEDYYLTRAEKTSLGIGIGRVGQSDPCGVTSTAAVGK